jgi:hypothetical protein
MRAVSWMFYVALGGIIGNRADAILLQTARYLFGEGKRQEVMPSPQVSNQDTESQEPIASGMMAGLDAVAEDDEAEDPHNHLYLDIEQVDYNYDKEDLLVTWSVGLDTDNPDPLILEKILETNLLLSDLEMTFTEYKSGKKHTRRAQSQNIKLPPQAVYSQIERFGCKLSEVIGSTIDIRCRFQVQCKDSSDHSVRKRSENVRYMIDWSYEDGIDW